LLSSSATGLLYLRVINQTPFNSSFDDTRSIFPFSLSPFILFLLALALFACSQEPETAAVLTEEEVAEIMKATFSETNGGVSEEMVAITEEVEQLTLTDICDSLFTDTLLYTFGPQAGREARLEADWSLEISCGGLLDLPETADVGYNSAIAYSTPRIDSDDAASFSGTLSGLKLTDPVYFWSGTYQRSGTQELRFRTQNNINTELDITLSNIEISKGVEPTILSGSGTYSAEITLNGNTSPYVGTLTFNGNGTATVVINGMAYTINLN